MKLKLTIATTLLVLLSTGSAYAQDISVNVNNTPIDFTTAQPAIIEGRTLVPLRGVFEKLGFNVEWDAATKTATLKNNSTVVTAKVNELSVTKNNTTEKIADVQPQIINDYFMVPVRAISEAAGCQVSWDSATKTVAISTQTEGVNSTEKEDKNYKGTLTTSADEYINTTYNKIKEIREYIKSQNDQVLMRFLGLGYIWDKEITATVSDYSKLNTLLSELKAITPPEDLKECQDFINIYYDMMSQAINLSSAASSGTISSEQLLNDIDLLKDEKEIMAIEFSSVLYDVMNNNNVFFEGAYDEYVLDMLK